LSQRSLLLGAIVCFIALIAIILPLAIPATSQIPPSGLTPSIERALSKLAAPRPHPLPATLAVYPPNSAGDYFDQVKTTLVGSLVWSSFPVTVYIQPETTADQSSPFLQRRSQQWISAVQQAIEEWTPLIPCQIVEDPQGADISVWRSTPPLKLEGGTRESGDRRLSIPRARSAETRYELYAKPATVAGTPPKLAHRMTIYIRPDQAPVYLQAAARHELGHALGIWGHSPNQSDALYFSQVRNPAKISFRDINTLKRVYEQPTRLGWEMKE